MTGLHDQEGPAPGLGPTVDLGGLAQLTAPIVAELLMARIDPAAVAAIVTEAIRPDLLRLEASMRELAAQRAPRFIPYSPN